MCGWVPIPACDSIVPGDAYFVYESCPMSDRTKLTCFYFRLIKIESEILSCQNRERCSRVLYL